MSSNDDVDNVIILFPKFYKKMAEDEGPATEATNIYIYFLNFTCIRSTSEI